MRFTAKGFRLFPYVKRNINGLEAVKKKSIVLSRRREHHLQAGRDLWLLRETRHYWCMMPFVINRKPTQGCHNFKYLSTARIITRLGWQFTAILTKDAAQQTLDLVHQTCHPHKENCIKLPSRVPPPPKTDTALRSCNLYRHNFLPWSLFYLFFCDLAPLVLPLVCSSLLPAVTICHRVSIHLLQRHE